MNLDWARALRDLCVRNNVPFYFKQVGGVHCNAGGHPLDGKEWRQVPLVQPGR